ncbi:MAG: family 10 glycosylhydrolase, partial [Gemmatimonadetes bacterium]|nr:family 10 glycosylhydrolase [Gemmatimonadota bacterium]
MREFRAVWVATVDNIDWPSEPGLPTQQQKSEALAILDNAVALGLNAIVLQVRPHCDALYPSTLEPWSSYLTGVQGTPPSPYYDPLQLWTNEAHARGLELHAWFNPFRADHPANPSEMAPDAIALRSPELAVTLGDKGYRWLDPSRQEVHDHSLAVIRDVVERYDIDGIHLDDYFYPYPSYNDGQDFPDDMTWARYVDGGGDLNRSDWRRHHVDRFVERLYRVVKSTKPSVKVGISPFGIWRPGYPKQIKGMDAFKTLYADALLWWQLGWVDYLAPQLYWSIADQGQSFPVLLKWWAAQNKQKRHLWPGISIAGTRSDRHPFEILKQINATRLQAGVDGQIHYGMNCILTNRQNIAYYLQKNAYKSFVLPPASPWLTTKRVTKPRLLFGI